MAASAGTSSVSVEAQGPPALSFSPFLPSFVLVALALALGYLAFRSYARSTRPLSVGRRLVLGSARLAAALVILVCLARPVWMRTTRLSERSLCFIALDGSSSMNFRDAPEGRTRWEFAGSLFARHQKELAELGNLFEIRRIIFDAVPREAVRLPGEDASLNSERPAGRATDVGALVERLAADAGGTACAGALLISDGRHNTSRDPTAAAKRLPRAGVPLFVVGVGADATPADYREVQVRLLEVPERAFVGGQVAIKIEIESQLSEPLRTPLVVTVNGEKVLEESLALPAGPEFTRREVVFKPAQVGMHRVVAAVVPLPREANVNNNVRSAFFRVYRNRLGVWYVEGTPRKEFGAIRSALESAPNVSLYALNAFSRLAGPEHDLLPQKEEAWKELRLVILGDLSAKRFASVQVERLAKFTAEGGGLLMIGGIENFGAGGWQSTALAEVLPVELSGADGSLEGLLTLELTADGSVHPVARIAEDSQGSMELWKRLPLLSGINAVRRVKPAAKVLLTAGGHPLLVVQEYGKGRSAAFTGDATWQWALKAGQDDAQRRFWRNLATWLAHSDYREVDKAVFVETDRLRYLQGDAADLRAHVQETTALQGTFDGVRAMATLELEGSFKKSWEMGQGPGDFSARNHLALPGNYQFKVEAVNARGEILGSDAVSFHVEVPDLESENPRADLNLLKRLAALSGGKFYPPEHATAAFQELLRRANVFSKSVHESEDLWNHWALFLAFLALVTLEWALRKRWGLV